MNEAMMSMLYPHVLTFNRYISYSMVQRRRIQTGVRTPWRNTHTRHEGGSCCRRINCERTGHGSRVSEVDLVRQFWVNTVKDNDSYQWVASPDCTREVVSRWQWLTVRVACYFWRVCRGVLKMKWNETRSTQLLCTLLYSALLYSTVIWSSLSCYKLTNCIKM